MEEIINGWKVLEKTDMVNNYTKPLTLYKCICTKCNTHIKYIVLRELRNSKIKCELCRQRYIDSFIGRQFGKLEVIEYSGKDKHGHHAYKCKCSCVKNSIKIVTLHHLTSGKTVSCGCYNLENVTSRATKHGLCGTRIYNIYRGIKCRCYNFNNPRYKDYGGRGITMSDEWYNDFINFYNDMNESYKDHISLYGEEDTTIDRIDVDGNYCKENCRWATNIEQANNKRNSVYILLYGKYFTISQISEMYNIPRRTVEGNYYKGTLYNLLENYTHSKYPVRNNKGTIDVIRFV